MQLQLLSLFFLILSLSAEALAEDLRDVQPPVAYPPNFLLWRILLGVVAAGLLYFLIRFFLPKIRHKEIEATPSKSSWEIAYERLAALAEEKLPQKGKANEFFTRLSLIVRHYMEDRFSIQAPEMTTEEFLASLKRAQELTDKHKGALREFCNFSDMVKFARYSASVPEMEEGFSLAKRLVDETCSRTPEG